MKDSPGTLCDDAFFAVGAPGTAGFVKRVPTGVWVAAQLLRPEKPFVAAMVMGWGWRSGAARAARVWVSCGEGPDLDEVVSEDAVSAPGSGSADAGEFGAVPAVASFDVVDPSFGLRSQQQRDQAKRMHATSIEVPSSHVAMLAYPEAVADLIIKAAE